MVSWFPEFLGSWAWIFLPVSLLTFAGTLVMLPVLLLRIPEDYFLKRNQSGEKRHWAWHLAKNVAGLIFLLMGFIMLFIPGQGLLTILAGLWLMDIPGKRAMQMKLLRRPSVRNGINHIRRKGGKAPLRLPREGEEPEKKD